MSVSRLTLTHESKTSSDSLVSADASHGDRMSGNSVTETCSKGSLTGDIGSFDLLDNSTGNDIFNNAGVNFGTSENFIEKYVLRDF